MVEEIRRRRSVQLIRRLSPLIPQMVKDCPQLIQIAPAENWRIQHQIRTLSDMIILVIGPEKSLVTAVLQIPGSKAAITSIEREKKALSLLQQDTRLTHWRRILPRLLFEGRNRGRPYWIFERLDGVNSLTEKHNKYRSLMELAAETVGALHQITAREVVVDDEFLDKWVFAPLGILRRSPLVYYRWRSRTLLDRLGRRLADALIGQQLTVSWIHGDYWEGNILFSPDGQQINGILDWDQAQSDGLPALDLVSLLSAAYRMKEGKELGEILVEIYKQGAWQTDEQVIWEQALRRFDGGTPGLRDSLMLFWLHHESGMLLKSERYLFNPIWALGNYKYVVDHLMV